jgi:hypothetical protein
VGVDAIASSPRVPPDPSGQVGVVASRPPQSVPPRSLPPDRPPLSGVPATLLQLRCACSGSQQGGCCPSTPPAATVQPNSSAAASQPASDVPATLPQPRCAGSGSRQRGYCPSTPPATTVQPNSAVAASQPASSTDRALAPRGSGPRSSPALPEAGVLLAPRWLADLASVRLSSRPPAPPFCAATSPRHGSNPHRGVPPCRVPRALALPPCRACRGQGGWPVGRPPGGDRSPAPCAAPCLPFCGGIRVQLYKVQQLRATARSQWPEFR